MLSGYCSLPPSEVSRPLCCGHAGLRLLPGEPHAPAPCPVPPSPAGVVMVLSTSAFGTYFKLTQGSPSNSSHVDLLAPVSMEPADPSVGLAWLAVGSMCLFIAGERGPVGGRVGTDGFTLSLLHSDGSQQVQAYLVPPVHRGPKSALIALATGPAPS